MRVDLATGTAELTRDIRVVTVGNEGFPCQIDGTVKHWQYTGSDPIAIKVRFVGASGPTDKNYIGCIYLGTTDVFADANLARTKGWLNPRVRVMYEMGPVIVKPGEYIFAACQHDSATDDSMTVAAEIFSGDPVNGDRRVSVSAVNGGPLIDADDLAEAIRAQGHNQMYPPPT